MGFDPKQRHNRFLVTESFLIEKLGKETPKNQKINIWKYIGLFVGTFIFGAVLGVFIF